ncbi:MAG: type VII toxin-antitoxin system MntA family adenylyltransferase antitoxin [Fusobacteriota bacterium]
MDEKIIEIIKDFLDVSLIYLFGSVNTDNFNFNSDIDIAILSKNKINDKLLFDLKIELVRELGREIDLINLNRSDPVLTKEIISKGKVIFKKDEKTKAEFEFKQLSLYGQYIDDISVIKEKIKKRGSVYGRSNPIKD